MASLPLPRFLEDHRSRVEHARALERVVRESAGDLRERKSNHTAVDAISLRGIPAIGRGVSGVIHGTAPGA
jgi:hypothetical protein